MLWKLVGEAYGYTFPEQSLEKLAILLFVTHLSSGMSCKLPSDWEQYVSQSTNCVVFIDNLMRNTEYFDGYKALSRIVADRLGLDSAMSGFNFDEIIDCDTFAAFDASIVVRICENLSLDVGEFEKYQGIINARRNHRFFAEFKSEYDCLASACEFFILAKEYSQLSGMNAAKLFESYTTQLYKLDLLYRHFIMACDELEREGSQIDLAETDAYLGLCSKVENAYTNWYLNELSIKWCAALDSENSWQMPGVTSQQTFYDYYVQNFMRDNERVIVIISDGLRYESAVELTEILNAEQKGTTELSCMLGVVPSYTKLGMAALLPHKSIEITDKAEILVDGRASQGTENREKILRQYRPEAVAITYENLLALSKQKGKLSERFKDVKLIYIYHNAIDARGDNARTEREVFDATQQCYQELSWLVKTLCNSISAINIFITADHGYIYRRTPLAESDKMTKRLPRVLKQEEDLYCR